MPKVWRATLHTEELTSCGFEKSETDEQRWHIIQGLLKAKGIPENYLEDRYPFRCTEVEQGLCLEFDG